MTRAEIENTDWAVLFRTECPEHYEQAIAYALTPQLPVRVRLSTELGGPLWAITPQTDDEFWLAAFRENAKANRLCRTMGWRVAT